MSTTSVEEQKNTPIFPDESANKSPRSILVVESDDQARGSLSDALQGFGYRVTGQVADPAQAMEYCREQRPDLVIVCTHDSGAEAVDAVAEIWKQHRSAVIVMTEELIPAHVFAFNVAGAVAVIGRDSADANLRATIESAYSCAFAIKTMEARIEQLERNLVNRRLVEEAKWKMVADHGMTEPEAHSKLQHHARSERIQLAVVAERVLKGELDLQ